MNKSYVTIALAAAALAACTAQSTSQSDEEIRENSSNFAKIDVVAGTLEDARDGKSYKTVKINNQVWMAENLNFKIEGTVCPGGADENCATLGRFYTWEDAQTACPEGWHLPADAEWDTLIEATGDVNNAAKALRAKTTWKESDVGVDQYGFAILPTGFKSATSSDCSPMFDASFWALEEYSSTSGWGRFVDGDYSVKRRNFDKKSARSVRCIQD